MPDDPLARLRAISLGLPEATEKLSWESTPTFRVREKIFALFDRDQAGRAGCWVKAPPGMQEALVGADPERYYRPPYLGGRGWLGIRLDAAVDPDWDDVEARVEESWRLVAPKKLAAGHEG